MSTKHEEPIIWHELTTQQRDALVTEKIFGRKPLGEILRYTGNLAFAFAAMRAVDGWTWSVAWDYDGDTLHVNGTAGDCNCNHRKRYDPGDHHGFSAVEEEIISNLPEAMCVAALRAAGVPINTMIGKDWGDEWRQCPWCGDLILLKKGLPRAPHEIEKCIMNREVYP